jgi:hypothetical protein
VGSERAETYLRLLAEVQLRQAGDRLRALDAGPGMSDRPDPGMAPFTTAEGTHWRVARAGRILEFAGVLDRDDLVRIGADLYLAIKVRSRIMLNWDRRRGVLHRTMLSAPDAPVPLVRPVQAMRVTPIGRALRVTSDHARLALHLLSLVRTETEAMITVVMRIHWPPHVSSTYQVVTGAGPHHLPYDQLWAVDDQGTRYTIQFDPGKAGPAAWRGIARLSPVPPHRVRRLDLIGDGTPLIQLPLGPPAAPDPQAAPPSTEPAAIPPGERLLMLEAERILASGDARGPVQGPDPGEIITVLTEAGAIAVDSPLPGQLAALCQRLGAAGHAITVPATAEIPPQWASIIAQHSAPIRAGRPEVFAPLADVLPEVDGARFALAGLSMAAAESHLHVVSSGMPPLAERFAYNWQPGFSWWLADDTGNWHVAAAGEPCTYGDGAQAFQLQLTPPLATVPDVAEVVVTGPATRVRATVPIRRSGQTRRT